MPDYPVRPSHPYGMGPAEEEPTRDPYGQGWAPAAPGAEDWSDDEYDQLGDDYGRADGYGDDQNPDSGQAWRRPQRDDRYGRPEPHYGQRSGYSASEEEFRSARPLSRRARREMDPSPPEPDERPAAWGAERPEPRWSGRSRLPSADGRVDPQGERYQDVEPPQSPGRSRYRSLGPLTTGMMNLIRGNRRVEPSDETNPYGVRPVEEKYLNTQRQRPSFFDMESEAPEPGWTSGDQQPVTGNGSSFPSLGGSRTGPPPPRAPQSFRRPEDHRRRLPLIAAVLVVVLVIIGGVAYALGSRGDQGAGTAADGSVSPSDTAASTPADSPTPSTTKAAVTTGAAKKVKLGVFKSTSPSQVGEFSEWLGRDVAYAADFSTRASWDEIANPTYMLGTWKNSGYRMIYAVAMLPTDSKSATLKAGAAGDYDQYYKTLARNLVAYDQGDSIIRLGWEFNVGGWPWHPGSADQENFIGYWRHIVKAMRSVPGTDDLQFDWNVNNGGDSYDSTLFWPGKKYVDYVGVDVYDTSWEEGTYPYPANCDANCKLGYQETAWDDLMGAQFGLAFWSSFAQSQGKKLSLPEWGLWDRPDGHGGGDNTYFIEQMYKFIDNPANNVAYQAYFDFNTASKGNHELETLDKAGAKYKKLFSKK